MKTSRLPLQLLAALSSIILSASTATAVDDLLLINKDGQSLEASVVSQQGDTITIRRSKDRKEFTIPLDSLNESSQEKVKKELKRLAESFPELGVDVVIGKRRQDYQGSDYRKLMEITTKTTVTNKNLNRDSPACDGNIIILGQDQRNDYKFKVLSNQTFSLTPTNQGAVFEAKPVFTVYDSDNKGYGNIGGYKYVGYIIILADKKDAIIHFDSNYSTAKKLMDLNIKLVEDIRGYSSEKLLDDKLKPYEFNY